MKNDIIKNPMNLYLRLNIPTENIRNAMIIFLEDSFEQYRYKNPKIVAAVATLEGCPIKYVIISDPCSDIPRSHTVKNKHNNLIFLFCLWVNSKGSEYIT